MKRYFRTETAALAVILSMPLLAFAGGAGSDHSGMGHGNMGKGKMDHGKMGQDAGAMERQARHGGTVLMAGSNHFEVTFGDSGIHVFAMDTEGTPVTSSGIAGKLTLRARRGDPAKFDLRAMRDKRGRVTALMLKKDFSKVRDGTRKAYFELTGLGEKKKFSLVLRRPVGGGAASDSGSMAGSHSSMGDGASGAAARGKIQRASIKKQREQYPLDWCVVTGEELEDITELVHEGRLLRFCCKGCVGKFKASPAKYLAKLDKAARGERVRRPVGSGSSR